MVSAREMADFWWEERKRTSTRRRPREMIVVEDQDFCTSREDQRIVRSHCFGYVSIIERL
jgi:hypothetical protein